MVAFQINNMTHDLKTLTINFVLLMIIKNYKWDTLAGCRYINLWCWAGMGWGDAVVDETMKLFLGYYILLVYIVHATPTSFLTKLHTNLLFLVVEGIYSRMMLPLAYWHMQWHGQLNQPLSAPWSHLSA